MLPWATVIRDPANRRLLLAALALASGVACAAGGGGEKGPAKMRVVRNETSVEVAVGEGIDLVVTRPVGIPEQLQCGWPAAPRIEGGALRFVRRRVESPPPEDDGGVTTLHYELEAFLPGASRVLLEPKPAGPEARCRSVAVEVTVRREGAR